MRTPVAQLALLVILALVPGCSAPPSDTAPSISDTTPSISDTTPSTVEAEPWYRQARALDLNGDGRLDSVRIDAHGTQPDSVQIVLRLLVDGQEKHRETWASSYELQVVEPTPADLEQGMNLLRARLDTVLTRVKGERLDAPGVRLMAEDSAVMANIDPRPTYRVSISYGFETTIRLVWDSGSQRFVRLFSCC